MTSRCCCSLEMLRTPRLTSLFHRSYTFTTCPLLQVEEGQPTIPLVPKKRDPNAVLKALASTVSPLKDPFVLGRTGADPLAPLHRSQMMEYMMAKEAGKMAALDVIRSNPKIFRAYQPTPDLRPKVKRVTGFNQDTLKYLVKSRKTERALRLHKALKEKGQPIALETENALLALLAYYGRSTVGKSKRTAGKKPSEKVTEELTELIDEEELEKQEGEEKIPSRPVWSEDNLAEQFFAKMEQKDGGTYGAMIQGLVKFEEFDRAMDMFEEAKSKGYQLSTASYNCVLQCIPHGKETKLWQKAKSILTEMTMAPPVQPDITTFNSLLAIASNKLIVSRSYGMRILREMLTLEIKPSLSTFTHLLKIFMIHRDASILAEIVKYIAANQDILTLKDPMDIYFFSTAMTCARLSQNVEIAIQLKKLAMKDHMYLVDSVEFFFNNYLPALATGPDPYLTKDEHDSLVPLFYRPRDWLYMKFFMQCEVHGTPEIALHFWKCIMKNRVVTKDIALFVRLMGAFSKNIDPMHCKEYVEATMEMWNKINYFQMNPTPFIISMTIKLLVTDGQINEAWNYYKLFDKYQLKPTFLALVSLLKAYYHSNDTGKVAEIFDVMLKCGHSLPTKFVQDVCHRCNFSPSESDRFIEGFQRNKPPADSTEAVPFIIGDDKPEIERAENIEVDSNEPEVTDK